MPSFGQDQRRIIDTAVEVVSAYVARNPLPIAQLPTVLAEVYAALQGLSDPPRPEHERASQQPTPVQIRKSITPDAMISFIDGKPYKTLKRHLTGHGLDPQTYRARYGLPKDYPMVAPSYAARRSELAKAIGLGLARPDAGLSAVTSQAETVAARAGGKGSARR